MARCESETPRHIWSKMNVFLIALGANLPLGTASPADTLNKALAALPSDSVTVEEVSRFYRTPCFPAGAGPDYVNAAARLRAPLTAQDMLAHLHQIETEFGRERNERWGMRTLDLDLIAAQDSVLPDLKTFEAWRDLPPEEQRRTQPDQLILPHPRLQDRAFVLVPLCDVAADWVHPVLKRSVRDMCAALPAEDLAQIFVL